MPRRVLLISRCPPYPLHLGDRLIIWHLLRELSQRGYIVDLLAYAQTADDHTTTAPYKSYVRHIRLIDEPARSLVSYLQRILIPGMRFPAQAADVWSPQMWHAIDEQLHAHDYDVVQVFGGVQVYEFAHLLRDYPAVITPYESYSLYLTRQIEREDGLSSLLPRVQRIVARQFERWMFTPYDRVVVVAPPDKHALQQLNSTLPVTVIPNGIDLDFFQPPDDASQRDSHTILFLGNYEYPPNVDAALVLARQILPAVRQHLPQVTLQIVGNAPPPQLQALAADTEHIIVTGRVPDVRPYLARCGAFVCALRLGAGIKNKVLEALAMGAPLVATPLSVDGIAVTDGEDVLIAPIEEMAAATVRLLRDAELRTQLSRRGRALIESRYSWSRVAADYHALYTDIIESR